MVQYSEFVANLHIVTATLAELFGLGRSTVGEIVLDT